MRILFAGGDATRVKPLLIDFERDYRVTIRVSSSDVNGKELRTFKPDMVVFYSPSRDRNVEKKISAVRNGGNGHRPRILVLSKSMNKKRKSRLLVAGGQDAIDMSSEREQIKAYLNKLIGLERLASNKFPARSRT